MLLNKFIRNGDILLATSHAEELTNYVAFYFFKESFEINCFIFPFVGLKGF